MKKIYTTINKKGSLNDISKEELLKIEDITGAGGTINQNNINRIPSATYSELGITPESTLEEKQIAIATYLEGYEVLETDNIFFEIKDNPILPYNFDITGNWGLMGITDQDSFTFFLNDLGATDLIVSDFRLIDGRLQCVITLTELDYLDLMELEITDVNIFTVEGVSDLDLDTNLLTKFNPILPIPTGLNLIYLNNNNITDWSLSEPFANTAGNQTTIIRTSGNPTSPDGTTFKTILESKGWEIY